VWHLENQEFRRGCEAAFTAATHFGLRARAISFDNYGASGIMQPRRLIVADMSTPPARIPRPGCPVSPCVDICALDDSNVCVGCGRKMGEIVRWAAMTADEQWQIVLSLPDRSRQ